MINKLVLIRTTNNLHVIGKKNILKSIFSKYISLKDPYFVDFIWNGNGQIERVYMNTMKLIYAKDTCNINNRHVLFEVEPDSELEDIYNNMLNVLKNEDKDLDL